MPGSIIHFAYTVTSFAVSFVVSDDPAVAATSGSSTLTDPVSSLISSYLPTAVGLATIPMIVEPIDETIHKVHDMSIRPTLSASIESFNKFESSLLSTTSPGADGDASNSTLDSKSIEEKARDIDIGATLKGGAALAMAVTFAPIAFTVSDVIDALH